MPASLPSQHPSPYSGRPPQADGNEIASTAVTSYESNPIVAHIESFVHTCTSRQRHTLRDRIFAESPVALHDFAVGEGITAKQADRIEQDVRKLTERLSHEIPRLLNLSNRILSIARPLASLSRVQCAVPEIGKFVPSLSVPLFQVLSTLDDRFTIEAGWVMAPTRDAVDGAVASAIVECATPESLSSIYSMADQLNLPAPELARYATEQGHRIHDGHLISKGLPTPDSIAATLALHGVPMTITELLEGVFPRKSESSVRNALVTDTRFLKSDKNSFALSRWGLTPYVPIHRQIANIVDERGGVDIDQLVAEITRSYDVKEHSIRTYAGTGDFVIHDRVVTRRKQKYVPRKSPSQTKHLYRDGTTIRWRTKIGAIHRKGSAFNLPSALSALLDVGPGAPRDFSSRLGPQSVIWVSVQARSGTIKRFVEDMHLADGEDVFLRFGDGEFDIERVPMSNSVTPRVLVQRIGRTAPKRLPKSTALQLVADSLWLEPTAGAAAILDVLRGRRETELIDIVESLVRP